MCFFNLGTDKIPAAKNVLTYTRDFGSSEPCGMDYSTGIFTVSIEGLYHFSINVVRKSKSDTSVLIRIDNSNVCSAWSDFQESDEWGEAVSCSIVRFLKPGQKVHAYLYEGSLFPSHFVNQFHGFLIR